MNSSAPLRAVLIAAAIAAALSGCATLPNTGQSSLGGPPAGAPSAESAPIDGRVPMYDPAAAMVSNAASMLGQPYRFGGAAPGGFDCSGLVVYAAGRAGFRLPRTAQEQLHAGLPIRRHEVQAGDLVFMHLAHKELHVGIAIDGERFVHAPSSGGFVRIDSLAAPPYSGAFLSARRVVERTGGP